MTLAGGMDDVTCTFVPTINPDSQRLLGDATNLPSTFAGRQQHYQEAKARRLQELRAELVRSLTALSATRAMPQYQSGTAPGFANRGWPSISYCACLAG